MMKIWSGCLLWNTLYNETA